MGLEQRVFTSRAVWQKYVLESFVFHLSAPPRQLVIWTHMFATTSAYAALPLTPSTTFLILYSLDFLKNSSLGLLESE